MTQIVSTKEMPKDVLFVIAKHAHEANRLYCAMNGDLTQKPWDDAEEWQRASAIDGVLFVLSGNANEPCDMHNAWMNHKLKEGWVYGETKDATLKTHPCLVPFESLPTKQQFKDVLFLCGVKAWLSALDGI